MSELTFCNYCDLKWIREQAKKDGLKVSLVSGALGGTDVYVHPESINMKNADEKKRDVYFAAWFMKLPDECCC